MLQISGAVSIAHVDEGKAEGAYLAFLVLPGVDISFRPLKLPLIRRTESLGKKYPRSHR